MKNSSQRTEFNKTLKHIALIMDGNGRWARKRLLPRSIGHREGLKTIEVVTDAARELKISHLSFFAFSTENWNRPKQEVDSLMELLKTKLPQMAKKAESEGTRLAFSGDTSAFDSALRDVILQAKALTEKNKEFVLNICLNYGARQEIVDAVNQAVRRGNRVSVDEFSKLLYTADLPDPDLMIRTGGEKRISNFLLFQSAYTELYFSDKLWPDFSKNDFIAAIDDYNKRIRRFGKI